MLSHGGRYHDNHREGKGEREWEEKWWGARQAKISRQERGEKNYNLKHSIRAHKDDDDLREREREREAGRWVPPAYCTVSPEYCISPTGTLTLQDDITRFGGWEERLISSQRKGGGHISTSHFGTVINTLVSVLRPPCSMCALPSHAFSRIF